MLADDESLIVESLLIVDKVSLVACEDASTDEVSGLLVITVA